MRTLESPTVMDLWPLCMDTSSTGGADAVVSSVVEFSGDGVPASLVAAAAGDLVNVQASGSGGASGGGGAQSR